MYKKEGSLQSLIPLFMVMKKIRKDTERLIQEGKEKIEKKRACERACEARGKILGEKLSKRYTKLPGTYVETVLPFPAMKNRLINCLLTLWLMAPAALLQAQGNYIGATLHPQLGKLTSPVARGVAGAGNFELNLGRDLKKGKVFETGLGVRQQGFRFSYPNDYGLLGRESEYYQRSTLLIAPARIRFHINQRSEGKHQLWINLGYIYGRRILADAWLIYDDEPDATVKHELEAGGKNYHFAEFGFEVDAPLGENHRIGLSINYTAGVTTLQTGSYQNTVFSLPGIKIRFARRKWRIQ